MKTISQQIADAALQLNPVELVTPINEVEAAKCFKKSFGQSHSVCPSFRYNRNRLKKAVTRGHRLQKLEPALALKLQAVPPLKAGTTAQNLAVIKIILRRLSEAIDTGLLAEAVLKGDDYTAVSITKRKYGTPDSDLVIEAYNDAERKKRSHAGQIRTEHQSALKSLVFEAEEIREIFEQALELYGIHDWMLSLDSQATAIDCRDKNSSGRPIIVIPAARRVNGLKLLELIGHEIECHVRDSSNARAFWQSVLADDYLPLVPLLAKSDNELIYEGHAKYVDTIVAGSKAAPVPWYVIAIDQALHKKSFASVARTIVGLKAAQSRREPSKVLDSAWSITRRVFRGNSDPRNNAGYAFTKDFSYYAGIRTIARCPRPEFASMTSQDIDELLAVGFELKPTFENKWLCLRPERLGLIQPSIAAS